VTDPFAPDPWAAWAAARTPAAARAHARPDRGEKTAAGGTGWGSVGGLRSPELYGEDSRPPSPGGHGGLTGGGASRPPAGPVLNRG